MEKLGSKKKGGGGSWVAEGERPQRHFQPVNASRWRRCETDSYHSCVPHIHFPQSCEVVILDSQPNLRH